MEGGRIIEGITGGSIGAIFAYFADIIPARQRTKYFGWASAVAGAGTVLGPALGGLLAKFDYAAPMYAGAIISLLNAGYGFLYMPESLDKKHRRRELSMLKLNPFTQLASVLFFSAFLASEKALR